MRARSASGIHDVRSGVDTIANHSPTHTSPIAPVTTNDTRHEVASINQATSGALSAGPSSVPAWMQPTANPRSVYGAQSRTLR